MHFDLTDRNAVALEVVRMLHPIPVYAQPQLRRGPHHSQGANLNEPVGKVKKRRRDTRLINEELSRYYQVPPEWSGWECRSLLKKGKYVTAIRR